MVVVIDDLPVERLRRALVSLDGLSVGDALASQFFVPGPWKIDERTLPDPPWQWTDDTQTACSLVSVLAARGEIVQDELAALMAQRFDPNRGYGVGMHVLFHRVLDGEHWSAAAPALFDGNGSYGNGAAMRVTPVGAYFADDLDAVVAHAARSAEVTHSHDDAIAGAIAVAVAAAIAARSAGRAAPSPAEVIDEVIDRIPAGRVLDGLRRARALARQDSVEYAAYQLGNGSQVTASDTVPFVIWSAARRFDDYEDAIWRTIEGGGDVDTTCAMVGGIVAARVGVEAIPAHWLDQREALPEWIGVAT
jgi:ADP-ribosylglycohydrolase